MRAADRHCNSHLADHSFANYGVDATVAQILGTLFDGLQRLEVSRAVSARRAGLAWPKPALTALPRCSPWPGCATHAFPHRLLLGGTGSPRQRTWVLGASSRCDSCIGRGAPLLGAVQTMPAHVRCKPHSPPRILIPAALQYRGYDSAGVCVDAPTAEDGNAVGPLVIKHQVGWRVR